MLAVAADLACFEEARRHHGVITRGRAGALGLTIDQIDYRLRTGRWIAVHPGVYAMAGSPWTWHRELTAACYWARDGLASHRSAAALWGLAGFEPLLPIDITSTRCHLPPRSGLRVHHTNRLLPSDRTKRSAVPSTAIERTLLDLGAVAPPHRVAIAFDSALRRGLTTTERLDDYLRLVAKRGRRGCRLLRSLVRSRSLHTKTPESPLESVFFDAILSSGLPIPELQYEIRDGERFVARVDFAWPDERVALEMDGYEFHSGREEWERDRDRRNGITSLGWRVLHGTWREVRSARERLLARVASALETPA